VPEALLAPVPVSVGVAPCGTALTAQQVQLLDAVTGGLAERGVVSGFDGGQAGRHASLRAYDLLREVRAWPSALDLPAWRDPAGLVLEHGMPGLRAALLAAADKPLADLVVDERIARHELRWPEGQVAARNSQDLWIGVSCDVALAS
jgi:DNA primase